MSGNHTPTPWRVVASTPTLIDGSDDYPAIAQTALFKGDGSLEEACANAEFIVTAVNSYASSQAEIERLRALVDLIAEEAMKDNSPLGRSDTTALHNIRAALSGSKE